jgi:hypothetical protein
MDKLLDKIQEVEYFYSRMIKEKENREDFRYNLSAFLSAGRSVLQYSREVARINPGGQKWYDDRIKKDKYFGYFRDKRNLNMHEKPPRVNRDYKINMLPEKIYIGEAATFTIKDKNGNTKISTSTKTQPINNAIGEGLIESSYSFDDWIGPEDIFQMCGDYLVSLRKFIIDGKEKGFLA